MKMISLLYARRFSFMVFCCLGENVLSSMLGAYTCVGIVLLYVNIYFAVVLNTYVNVVVMSSIYEKGIKVFFANSWLIFSSGFVLHFILTLFGELHGSSGAI